MDFSCKAGHGESLAPLASFPSPAPPSSLLECLNDDGTLNDGKLHAFLSSFPEESFVRKRLDPFTEIPRPAKQRRAAQEREDFTESTWYKTYIRRQPTSKKALEKFRRRFRLPHCKFLKLIALAREKNWFPRAEKADASGRPGAPLELLVLGALRYLGRGWTFDDIEEETGISEETHRRFFHDFIRVGSTFMFALWVVAPATAEEIASCRREFEIAGFNGAFASTDGTHILWEKCTARLRNQHIGFKESHTTRAYNLTVNHRRKILSTSRGCPGSWNDKTLILFDQFLRAVHDGTIYQVDPPPSINCIIP